MVRSNRVNPLNRIRGQERRFSPEETLKVVNIFRARNNEEPLDNLEALQELSEYALQPPVSERSGPETGQSTRKDA